MAPAIWNAALDAQDEWESRLHALQRVTVISSRPVDFGNERYDEGFAWSEASGFRNVHAKAHLLDDFAVREKTWYRDADPEFVPVRVGDASCGLL